MFRFNSILYVVEPASNDDSALARAVSLAESNQAALTVMDVIPETSDDSRRSHVLPDRIAMRKALSQDRCNALQDMIRPYKDRLDIHWDVVEGKRSLEALRSVLRNNHDLLIKPAENPSYTRRIFGSEDMQLLRNCPCPLWLS